jgi:ATP-dependent RNA helicase RhlE
MQFVTQRAIRAAGGCVEPRKNCSLPTFHEFGLANAITRALDDEKYLTPTPIQAQAIPVVLAGHDLIGIAQTGTGKTAAFALPILNQLFAKRRPLSRKTFRALVLTPTRELASQICDSFKVYSRYQRLSTAVVIGGVPIGRQIRSLSNGIEVLVATPGRLLDLHRIGALRLDQVEFLVLDEVDRMLDMGFIHDTRKIVEMISSQVQTLFFSATMPPAIAELAGLMLRNPVKVVVDTGTTMVDRIEQRIIHVNRAAKVAVLTDVLKGESIDRVLVFTRTKRGADKVADSLAHTGIAAQAIHGNKSQNQRERTLAAFRRGDVRTLIATDIAARGIDIDGISHVVNFDLPNVPETYVHRIGRTGRAGAGGVAISLCDAEEASFLRDIEKLIRMAIPATDRRTSREIPRAAMVAPKRPSSRKRFGQSRRPAHQGTKALHRGNSAR